MGSRESGERGEGGHGKHKGVVIEVKILLTLPPTATRPTTVPSDPSGYTQHSLPHPHSDVQPRSHPPHNSTANDSMLRPLSGSCQELELSSSSLTVTVFPGASSSCKVVSQLYSTFANPTATINSISVLSKLCTPDTSNHPLHARSPNHTVVSSRSRILQGQLVSWPPDSDRAQREGLRISSRFLFPPCRSVTGGLFFVFVSALVLSAGWGYWDCEV